MNSSTSTSVSAPTFKTPLVVMTDLDGTLLDHHTYSTRPAAPALKQLKDYGIPVIFNTSKTSSEVTGLRSDLDNTSPFVCENGSVIFLPKADGEGYNTEVLGVAYKDIIRALHQIRQKGFKFRGFNDMPASEVAALTGLNSDDAYLSKNRAASEPMVWQDDESKLESFQEALSEYHLTLTKGGRFYHVMGETNKASAIEFFRQYYQHQWNIEPVIVALGDGENDRCMLEAADYPIVIPGDKTTLEINHPESVTAAAKGPTGWNQTMLELLKKLQ
ncbi:MAG: HAD-IIB family hydrolase [Oceanobacter sp.]